MDLSNLSPAEGSVHSNNFRRGRGHGSGNGKTAGKGHKGQKARSGGFKSIGRAQIETITLSDLDRFEDGADGTVDALIENGILREAKDGVKVLGNGTLTKKLNVCVNAYSASAKAKIEELGVKAEVI